MSQKKPVIFCNVPTARQLKLALASNFYWNIKSKFFFRAIFRNVKVEMAKGDRVSNAAIKDQGNILCSRSPSFLFSRL